MWTRSALPPASSKACAVSRSQLVPGARRIRTRGVGMRLMIFDLRFVDCDCYQRSGDCQASFKFGDAAIDQRLAVAADDRRRGPSSVTSPIAACGSSLTSRSNSAVLPAGPRRGIANSIRRTGARHQRHRRRCRAARRRATRDAPKPPANAISATATASPPSLRSWQARRQPDWIA